MKYSLQSRFTMGEKFVELEIGKRASLTEDLLDHHTEVLKVMKELNVRAAMKPNGVSGRMNFKEVCKGTS